MRSRIDSLFVALITGVIASGLPAAKAMAAGLTQYQQLPVEIRNYVEKVRHRCNESDPRYEAHSPMQGITVVHLERNDARDLLVDAEHLCSDWVPGANCSNRGCDLKIWKQVGQHSWKKVFDEHLYSKTISLGDNGRFKKMAVSIYAGNPYCKPAPGKSYTSGQSCDALVYYRKNHWVWKKIR